MITEAVSVHYSFNCFFHLGQPLPGHESTLYRNWAQWERLRLYIKGHFNFFFKRNTCLCTVCCENWIFLFLFFQKRFIWIWCLFVDVYPCTPFLEHFLFFFFELYLLIARYFIHRSFSIFNMSDVTSMTLPTIKILHLPLLSPMPVCFHQGTAALKLPRCPIGGKFIMITRKPQLKVYNDVSNWFSIKHIFPCQATCPL